MILAKAAAHRAHRSARVVGFMAETAAVAAVAMAKVARNLSKAKEATHKVLERHGNPVHASPAKSWAIGPRTAKQNLRRVPLPLRQNRSR
jgi:uncharacterized lipoprotein NlpE involved in copper resistance